MSKAPPELRCPRGHAINQNVKKLKAWQGHVHEKRCGACGRSIDRKEERWNCGQDCDYEICNPCWDANLKKEIQDLLDSEVEKVQFVEKEVRVPQVVIEEVVKYVEVPVVKVVEKEVPCPQIETVEKIVEVPRVETVEKVVPVPQIQTVEKIVEVEKVQFVEEEVHVPQVVIEEVVKYVEVPVVKVVEKEVPCPQIETVEKIVEVPRVETVEKVVPVPQIQIVEKIVEVDKVQFVEKEVRVPKVVIEEVVRYVPKVVIELDHFKWDEETEVLTLTSLESLAFEKREYKRQKTRHVPGATLQFDDTAAFRNREIAEESISEVKRAFDNLQVEGSKLHAFIGMNKPKILQFRGSDDLDHTQWIERLQGHRLDLLKRSFAEAGIPGDSLEIEFVEGHHNDAWFKFRPDNAGAVDQPPMF